ncbi:hypothetical protein D9613_010024 [Agrocybe pediades]|uniref:NADH dehydrogenase [ubiquinone] iron-sulfur protein 5 n=1 Tax=Agrocybe pediades TaxID=84607 RepID=A0A8H4QY04_9AGAR|nr:hypothetical protein D9613_010024 [Agrocybe pediades]
MASGFGWTGGRSKCFTYWQEFQKCYIQTDNRADCLAQSDDYLECLHHQKEQKKRTDTILKEYERQKALAAKHDDSHHKGSATGTQAAAS